MGPIALFDKSFLQSLSLDESVWLDHYFLCNICPIFFVETLADLNKSVRRKRTSEDEVRIIADKTPEMHGVPCAHHTTLCMHELMGYPVPMTGQIPVNGGRVVELEGKTGVLYEESEEQKAFSRWQESKFSEVEKQFAQVWRKGLLSDELNIIASILQSGGINGKSCKSLNDAKAMASMVVQGQDRMGQRMQLTLVLLGIPNDLHEPILRRWSNAGSPSLPLYSPYAAFVLTIEIFFHIAMAASLISVERPSNRTDIAYLFYLPFCMIFISSDRLHQNCASLFLRPNQQFVWGPDLKADFKAINSYFSQLPEEIKKKGIMSFAAIPPIGNYLTTKLWDTHFPGWQKRSKVTPRNPEMDKKFIDEFQRFIKEPAIKNPKRDVDADMLAIKRMIRRKKGSWWQLDKTIKSQS